MNYRQQVIRCETEYLLSQYNQETSIEKNSSHVFYIIVTWLYYLEQCEVSAGLFQLCNLYNLICRCSQCRPAHKAAHWRQHSFSLQHVFTTEVTVKWACFAQFLVEISKGHLKWPLLTFLCKATCLRNAKKCRTNACAYNAGVHLKRPKNNEQYFSNKTLFGSDQTASWRK